MTVKPEEIVQTLSTRQQLTLMRDLQRLANDRWNEESRIQTALAEGLSNAERVRDQSVAEVESHYSERRAQAVVDFEQKSAEIRGDYEAERNAAQEQYKGLRQGVESEHARVTREAQSEQQQASWEAQAVFEALKGKPRERFLEIVQRLERRNQELAVLENDAVTIMQSRRQWRSFPPVEISADGQRPNDNSKAHRVVLGRQPDSGKTGASHEPADSTSVDDAIRRVDALAGAVREAAVALNDQKLPRWFEGGNPFFVFFLAWLAAAIPCGLLLGWWGWQWPAVSLGIAVLATAGALAWLWPIARRHSGEQYRTVQQRLADARHAIETALEAARERGRREAKAIVSERDHELATVEQKLNLIVSDQDRLRESEMGRAGQTFPQRLAKLRESLDTGLAAAKQKHHETLAKLVEERDRREAENRERYEERSRAVRADHERDWQALAERWKSGLADLRESFAGMQAECERLFPDWDSADYESWQRPTETAPAIRFGEVTLDLAKVKNGIPQDVRLLPAETKFKLPALMTFEEHPVLLLTAEEEGRREAVEVLQLAMLRIITAMPPGKVRFTILDPVGLGENFASFMHLADYDEQLIASRIWTDGRQIEEQLTRLTAHMETVLQKYLRNEFATIHEYNAHAGEVAEPFQVLVVANFPANFSEAAARKLVSIATSGPRCGVYTMVSVDLKQRLPANFDLNDLAAAAVHLDWQARDGRFRWRYPAFEHLPLALDRPPSADTFNDVMRAAGSAAKDSMKVEVPFEMVAPDEEAYWKDNCGKELVVPIGRAGAMRLQSVRLGRGTSQHLLVCGKTGSGKSTFLHSFITNTALHYGPDQVEFYLIDFKKGVEFKTYATHHLPHARVIAIESEREFGYSVLERLDEELRRRGDLFRTAGVQDLPDYRAALPGEPMPRILLVVDEFQELFVEDDKLSQDSALLLDRLVRQGRAFGIHVMLGSQTLSGAYSLARSTMGQMAIRVALQCSEADAHVILSDERNTAARFLSRPGEAIYNDQNGLLAGNHPFQVVWLSEGQRVGYLRRLEAKSREQGAGSKETSSETPRSMLSAPRSCIVFEGDQPADPAANMRLCEILRDGPKSIPGGAQYAWLGAAVAIKEPTAATFARHAGSNLLVVGAYEESALGVMTNAVIALAAQNASRSREQSSGSEEISSDTLRSSLPAPRFFILDGTRPESTEAGTWQRVADALPHNIVVGGQRDVSRILGEVATELARRESAGEDDAPPVYLVIFNGGRFRELRRGEDDFSFSMDRDKPLSSDKQWAEILRNGPAWGVHSLLWCDSYNNVTRMLDRLALREFEMRVAFQMSAADSSSLLDTPAASRLRVHRGLFASEDLGTLEKFRPYGPPTSEWVEEVGQAFKFQSRRGGVM